LNSKPPTKRGKKMPRKIKDEALRLHLYLMGYNDREIADKLGVTRKTITEWRHKRGLPPQWVMWRYGSLLKALALVNGWMRPMELAEKLGMSLKKVTSSLRRLREMGWVERRKIRRGVEYKALIPPTCCQYGIYSKDVNNRYCIACGTFWDGGKKYAEERD